MCLPKTCTRTVAALLLLLCCLQACNTAKEISAKLTYRALNKDSTEPVRIISALHPCVDGKVVQGDSTAQQEYFRKLDSILNSYRPSDKELIHDTVSQNNLDCPDLVRDYNELIDIVTEKDRYIRTLNNQLKVKVPVIRDTIPVLDTKQVYLLTKQVNVLEGIKKVQANEITALKSGKKTLWIVILALLIPLLLSLYFNFRSKLNPIK